MLSARTGLHPEDQKLVYKDKERDSKAFLDMAGVKDRSKMVLLEDPAAQAKRLLEQRRTDKADPVGDGVPRRIRSVAARGGRIRRARTVRRGGLPPPRPPLLPPRAARICNRGKPGSVAGGLMVFFVFLND